MLSIIGTILVNAEQKWQGNATMLEENGDPHLAFSCYAKVMPFFAPTLKNIEFKGEIDTHNVSNITVDVNVHDVG